MQSNLTGDSYGDSYGVVYTNELTLRGWDRPGSRRDVTDDVTRYQSLHETVRAAGAELSKLDVTAPDFDLLIGIGRLLRPETKVVVLNFPHNPTGYLPSRELFAQVVALCNSHGCRLFCDEMYRHLEMDPTHRLPSACVHPSIPLLPLTLPPSLPSTHARNHAHIPPEIL